jgi:hypothetical protein
MEASVNKNISLVFVCFLAFVSALASAEENRQGGSSAEPPESAESAEPSEGVLSNAVGVYASVVHGPGLSYQRWNNGGGYQITAGGIYDPDNNFAFDIFLDYYISGGGQWQLTNSLIATEFRAILYLHALAFHRGFQEYQRRTITDDQGMYVGEEVTVGPFVPTAGLVGGIGLEFVLLEHLSLPIEIGYAPVFVLSPFGLEEFRFVVQGAIRYRF